MTQLSATYPDATARVICDVLNEPDFGNLRWEAQPNQGLPGMTDLYLNAFDKIYPIASGAHVALTIYLHYSSGPLCSQKRTGQARMVHDCADQLPLYMPVARCRYNSEHCKHLAL